MPEPAKITKEVTEKSKEELQQPSEDMPNIGGVQPGTPSEQEIVEAESSQPRVATD